MTTHFFSLARSGKSETKVRLVVVWFDPLVVVVPSRLHLRRRDSAGTEIEYPPSTRLRVAVPVFEMVKLRVATYLDAAIPGGFPLLSPLNPYLVESRSQLFDTSGIETYTTRV